MIILDFKNILVLISLAIHLSLILILYRYGRKTPGGKAYSVAVLSIAGWILPMFLYRSDLYGQVVLWARVLYIMASFTSTSFLFFTFIFPNDSKIPRWVEVLLALENIFIIWLCLHPTLMIRNVRIMPGHENIIIWGPLYWVYVLHVGGLFTAGLTILFAKMLRSTGMARRQVTYIYGGYFVASLLAMATNLILPWFGYFELNWLGQIFSTLVAVFTTYAILRADLLNIKLAATELFVIILNLLLFFQLLSSENSSVLTINIIVLMAALIISTLLINSVMKEIKRREEMAILAESLTKANARLQELDKQKTDFLSIAAHQLRTPISISSGYLELLNDGAYGEITPDTKQIFKNMDESNGRLIKLIDSFLDITRLEQGNTRYDFAEHDLVALVDGVVKEFAAMVKQKGLTLVWQPNANFPRVIFDEEKIRHVVFNFIDNAIKYSESGIIKVEVYQEGNGFTVRVRDNGIGFNKIDEANFFQKFYRGENVKGTNVNGTGLGLFVGAKFIEAHHGRFWAHSEGLGKGGEFGFWIPLHDA